MAVTIYGVCALSFMMVMYALEGRGRGFVALFALGCALSSAYGFLSGTWPFGVVEAIWSIVAIARFGRPAVIGGARAGGAGVVSAGEAGPGAAGPGAAGSEGTGGAQDQEPPSSSG